MMTMIRNNHLNSQAICQLYSQYLLKVSHSVCLPVSGTAEYGVGKGRLVSVVRIGSVRDERSEDG